MNLPIIDQIKDQNHRELELLDEKSKQCANSATIVFNIMLNIFCESMSSQISTCDLPVHKKLISFIICSILNFVLTSLHIIFMNIAFTLVTENR